MKPDGQALEDDPILALVNSHATRDDAPLKIGQIVQAEQGGKLWVAKITRVLKDGRVKITYEGWDASWDEIVPRSRLREPQSEAPLVTLHLEGGLVYRGTLSASAGEFLVMERTDAQGRVLVNRRLIAAVEIA